MAADGHEDGIAGRRVLLTGATGYLGSRLLTELRDVGAEVWCLARGDARMSATQRLRRSVARWGAESPAWHAIRGDITSPRLGLTPGKYAALASSIDVVIHAAAIVNGAFTSSALRAANVAGTASVIEFCEQAQARMIYISSSSVTSEIDDAGIHVPADDGLRVEDAAQVSGYALTKFLAERLIGRSAVPADIIRLPALAGDRVTGLPNPTDFRWLVLSCSIDMQRAPFLAGSFTWLPVDAGCAAVIDIARGDPADPPTTWHVLAGTPVPWLQAFSWLRMLGLDVRQVDVATWYQHLDRLARTGHEGAAMLASTPRLRPAPPARAPATWPGESHRLLRTSAEYTIDDLSRMMRHHLERARRGIEPTVDDPAHGGHG